MNTPTIRISLLLTTIAAGTVTAQEAPKEASVTPVQRLVRANTAFGCDLYRTLRSSDGNLFFSPYSITVALGMTRQGAVGETGKQMDKVLHSAGLATRAFPALEKALAARLVRNGRERVPAYELHTANRLWGQQGFPFEAPFVSLLKDEFGAPMQRIDFTKTKQARKIINDWVAAQTKDRILDIVPEDLPTPDCLLALGNAIYFKAAWAKAFKERATAKAKFTVSAKQKVDVSMMAKTGPLPYMEDETLQAVEIPYRGYDTSMVLVLPKKVDGLAKFEAGLTATRVAGIMGKLSTRAVALKMPKFEITMPLRLGKTLQAMGMQLPFTMRANFSKMTKADKLFIGAVLHKAFVKVDEKGTEAAAATIVMMKRGGRPRPQTPVAFVADHPFWFVVRHRRTGAILFMGRLLDPS